ncbi:MAG: biotin/lipoyl-containing protein, partial [Fidelibacterota bacterium]
MIVDVVMPKLGESITEGTIIEWRKKVGDTIKKDEILLEIGTDKVDSEIPSPASGVVVEILAKRNEVVPVDREIARINTEGSGAAEGPPPQKEGEVEEAPPEAAAVEEKRPPEGLVPEPPGEPAVKPQEKAEPAKKRSFYTPLVRSIARREGIGDAELAAIHGTGKGGRVTKIDVLTYLEKRPVVPEAATPAAVAPVAEEIAVPGVAAEEDTVEIDRVRQTILEYIAKLEQRERERTGVKSL